MAHCAVGRGGDVAEIEPSDLLLGIVVSFNAAKGGYKILPRRRRTDIEPVSWYPNRVPEPRIFHNYVFGGLAPLWGVSYTTLAHSTFSSREKLYIGKALAAAYHAERTEVLTRMDAKQVAMWPRFVLMNALSGCFRKAY